MIRRKFFKSNGMCKHCAGRCCKTMPGTAWPEDFRWIRTKNAARRIAEMIHSTQWALDYWHGSLAGMTSRDKWYYLRPAVKGYEHRIVDESWGGECVFLRSDGCKLSKQKRPSNCKMLKPKEQENGKCVYHSIYTEHPKEDGAIAWMYYQDLLEKARRLANEVA